MTFLLLLTFILAPAYVVRFNLLGLPTNLLMVWIILFWLIFFVWLAAKKQLSQFLTAGKTCDFKILLCTGLFFLSGIAALFIQGINRANLGQFIVLFVQPISLFFIAGYLFKQYPKTNYYLLTAIYCLLGIAGIYAVLQYFTLLGLPPAWWGNSVEPKRALSFFVHPNFYALWSAPLLALLLPDVGTKIKNLIVNRKLLIVNCLKTSAWLLGAVGLLLSLSRSGWLGLAVAIAVYLVVAADKKIRKIVLTGAIIALAVVVYYPNLRYRILLPFYGEKSASSRVELWDDGLKAVKESPVFGLGLTGFAQKYGALNTDPTLDTHNFPHNIFLNFWTETGLLGLISFIWLISLYIYRGLRGASPPFQGGVPPAGRGGGWSDDRTIKLAISLFLIALVFQGLVDNPYFKNDLALVFWIVVAMII
jgi:O-antigen ligase